MRFFTLCSTVVFLAAVPCLSQKLVDAGSPEVTIEGRKRIPVIQPLLSPFNVQRRYVSPAKLSNSPRLQQLVRAGNLYLSVDDVIALTLENNLDIAIQRYGSYLAREVRAAPNQATRRGPSTFPSTARRAASRRQESPRRA